VDHGRLALPAEHRAEYGHDDLARDLPGFDETARITPYVSRLASGLDTLGGPGDQDALAAVTPEGIDALLDFAGRFYELVLLDVAGDLDPAALRHVASRAD